LTDNKNSGDGAKEEDELSPEEEAIWKEYGKTTIYGTLSRMDERAKYMITTCASLIVIHFGLLLGFKIQDISIKITPEFFFVIAAGAFALSLFPHSTRILLHSGATVKKAYHSSLRWRIKTHYIGFVFFIAGLLAMAITAIIS